jgi:aminoglycoside phosphotransferase (APT) family kinase protein
MVRGGAVFLVDFDQFCLADPALDVGYFLAYLRPAGFWYHRAGRRAWFEAAADAFLTTYLHRLAERGESAATCAGIAGRAPVFEAALLLKIAARRANRLHSPRAGEVAAVLDEVSRSLGLAERRGGQIRGRS